METIEINLEELFGERDRTPRNVIIDCDPGIDDALALMAACSFAELNVLGITIVSGNIPAEQCAENALKVLKMMNRLDIPVYLGETGPLAREMVTAEDTHGSDGLGGILMENVTEVRYHTGAVEYIKAMLAEVQDVSIIAIGPLTNIARLIEKYPEAAAKIEELVVMGGAFKSHGNVSPVAEFNFWADPEAAEITLNQLGRPITLVPLDVTREFVLTPNHATFLSFLEDKKADFIVDVTKHYIKFHWEAERTLGCVVNDALALLYFINRDLCYGQNYYVDVITEGKTIGMSMVDVQGKLGKAPNATVLTDVNAAAAMALFLTKLFPDHIDEIVGVLNEPKYGVL